MIARPGHLWTRRVECYSGKEVGQAGKPDKAQSQAGSLTYNAFLSCRGNSLALTATSLRRNTMIERGLGKSGLRVSAVGLGCMGMSEFYNPKQMDDAESIRVIHRYLDAGGNLLDTADIYGLGRNEVLVGKAIQGRRAQVVLATKFGNVRGTNGEFLGVRGDSKYVRECCDASLQRLDVEVIDLYYQHRVDPNTPIEETVGAMADLVKAGKVRYLGLSEAAPTTIRRAAAIYPIAALQSEYSLWTRDPELAVLPAVRELGISFVAYSPLGRGFFTGSIKRFEDLAPDDYRRSTP